MRVIRFIKVDLDVTKAEILDALNNFLTRHPIAIRSTPTAKIFTTKLFCSVILSNKGVGKAAIVCLL